MENVGVCHLIRVSLKKELSETIRYISDPAIVVVLLCQVKDPAIVVVLLCQVPFIKKKCENMRNTFVTWFSCW